VGSHHGTRRQRAAWEALRRASHDGWIPAREKAREEWGRATTFAGYLRATLTRPTAPSPSLWRRRRSSRRTPKGTRYLRSARRREQPRAPRPGR